MNKLTSSSFKKNASLALKNVKLQRALKNLKKGFVEKRRLSIEKLPEFDQMREEAVLRKNQTLLYLDYYLKQFEKKVKEQNGQVHWAYDAKEACEIAIAISRSVNAKLLTKGKSMLTEEIGLNAALSTAGFTVVETDLGEYIIQLRNEAPSHIVAPAIHILKEEVTHSFYEAHQNRDPNRPLNEPKQLLEEAREILREKFLRADVGITGANFLIAENGATVIVTNEGNGDLTQTCAKVHIVMASIEKIIPTIDDAMNILRLLCRSATGQEITSYVTFSMGTRRKNDLDGPEQFHVILVDNGRSAMLGSEFREMLRCIRCGACLNHCPVYNAIGGQAYGSTYPGPMGAVLSPSLFGIKETHDLPNASTFCGRCEEVCPMKIPLPNLMRYYREKEWLQNIPPRAARFGLKIWSFFAIWPWIYHRLTSIIVALLSLLGKKKGRFKWLPLAKGWTTHRDLPAPSGKTFHALWRQKKHD